MIKRVLPLPTGEFAVIPEQQKFLQKAAEGAQEVEETDSALSLADSDGTFVSSPAETGPSDLDCDLAEWRRSRSSTAVESAGGRKRVKKLQANGCRESTTSRAEPLTGTEAPSPVCLSAARKRMKTGVSDNQLLSKNHGGRRVVGDDWKERKILKDSVTEHSETTSKENTAIQAIASLPYIEQTARGCKGKYQCTVCSNKVFVFMQDVFDHSRSKSHLKRAAEVERNLRR